MRNPAKRRKRIAVCCMGVLLFLLFLLLQKPKPIETRASSMWGNLQVRCFSPIFEYATCEEKLRTLQSGDRILLSESPVFGYLFATDRISVTEYMQLEDEDTSQIPVPDLTRDVDDVRDAFERENELAKAFEEMEEEQQQVETVQEEEVAEVSVFVPHERQMMYRWEDYKDYETLFDTFYAMDSHTMTGKNELNLTKLLSPDMTLDKSSQGPQILIYHTHSQEAFVDSVEGDVATTIVGVGEKLTKILTEEYGYQVLHHTGEYDLPGREGAYNRSLPAIEQLLADYPTIQVVIDLHRDGVSDDRRLVTQIDGRPTAQLMFFNGLSRSKNTGNIDYLENPNLQENLAFSFQMKAVADEYYPGLARKNYLNAYRYNMHLCARDLLIELGAQTNTVEEIMNAVEPIAHILDLVLTGEGRHD